MVELSKKERQVLILYLRLESHKLVAHALDRSEATVGNHLASVYNKLDVGTVVGAAKAMGWLEVPNE